jgi:tetratricopeptide (TPR) repeat protein
MTAQQTARELLAAAEDALYEAAFRSGDFTEADALLEAARDKAAGEGDRETEAAVIHDLGMKLHYQAIAKLMRDAEVPAADVAAEEEMFRRSLAIGREIERESGDRAGTARPLFGLGLVHQVLRRDWQTAIPFFWQALELADAVEAAGDLYSCSEFHRHIGFYYLFEDVRLDRAVAHLEISLAFRERLADPKRIPSALAALGEAESAAGNHRRAVDLLRRAVESAREAGLLPERVEDAEEALRQAESAAAAPKA